MEPYSIAFVVYGDSNSLKNALTEEKYKDLASAFISAGFAIQSVLYNDEAKVHLFSHLSHFDAILVWVNPLEQGKDRRHLDTLLSRLADHGCLVSAHPEAILKMGTKEVLYSTKDMEWGGPTRMYRSYEDFEAQFPESLNQSDVKVIKQYRGNGGNGVFKIMRASSGNALTIVPAQRGAEPRMLPMTDFFYQFKSYFENGGMLIEQDWNPNHRNGMIRCYMCGNHVAGFGYQEINALYEVATLEGTIHLTPSSRYYFSENCGLFADLKAVMETTWVPQLQQIQSIPNNLLPVIWDADFFINEANSPTAAGKYALCEINVSSVSPFPPSAIPFIVKEVGNRIQKIKDSKSMVG